MPETVLRVLDPEDRDAAAAVLARGFAQDPGAVAMLPDEQQRRRVLELSGRNVIGAAIPDASAYGVEVGGELGAIAVWRPPGYRPHLPTPAATGNLLLAALLAAPRIPHAAALGIRYRRGTLAFAWNRSKAVREASRGRCWHLAYLATDPVHRGQGLARRLLDHVLDRCDADGLAAWLETTDPANPPIYERFGFRTVAHIDPAVWLPGYWVMRREPGDRASG